MIFYILLFFYTVACFVRIKWNKTRQNNTTKVLLLLLPLFILAAFRSTLVGPDTQAYYNTFNYVSHFHSLVDAIIGSRMEPGYIIINYLFSKMGLNYYYMQVCLTTFIFLSIGRFINRYSEDVNFSCFYFYVCNMFFGIMNVVRMWIAVAVLLYSINSLKNKQLFRFVLIVILASMFHYTAAIFLLMYPLVHTRLTIKKITLIFIGSVIVWRFAIPVFSFITNRIGIYGNYLLGSRFDTSDNIAVLLTLLVSLSFFAFESYEKAWIKKDDCDTDYKGMQNTHEFSIAYVASVLAVAISIIGLSNNIMGRISHYFSIFDLILVPHAIFVINNRRNQFIVKNVIIILLVIKFIVILVLRPEWYQVIPYKFFFN